MIDIYLTADVDRLSISSWLANNVGNSIRTVENREYYGVNWEFRLCYVKLPPYIVKWVVRFTNDHDATLFKLTWL